MKRFTILSMAVIMASMGYIYDSYADRDATPEERAKVVEALTALGCPNVGEVEVEGNYFEADDVICDDGKKYEIYLNKDLEVIKKKLD